MNQPSVIKGLLGSLDLRVLTVQRTVAGSWWNFERVVSPFSRLWLILDGRATVKHHGRTFELRRGALHLVPAFTLHDCRCARRFDHFHLHFLSRVPTGIDLFSLLDCDWQVSPPLEFPKLLRRLEMIYPDRRLSCFDPEHAEYPRLPASLEQVENDTLPAKWLEAQGILRLLLAPFLTSARRHEEGAHAQVTRRFLAVQEFIHQHMSESITLADLARVAGLHPTYFSDRFLQLVGMRPLEYLMRRRMERAQYLLLASGAPVKKIAYEVGLRDPAYFTRAFTKYCSHSPSAYRAAHGL
ncbi:MAG: AraC family transcriptional regulator [Verrucomicrobiaceae bacterium]|nr:MAG: AraC family transcriptional regulator [Verrucomicrobiaceae bacterium]